MPQTIVAYPAFITERNVNIQKEALGTFRGVFGKFVIDAWE